MSNEIIEDTEQQVNNKQNASAVNEFTALQQISNILENFDEKSKIKLLKLLFTYFSLEDKFNVVNNSNSNSNSIKNNYLVNDFNNSKNLFSENRDISPKEFIREKNPLTDIEKIVCLAYYLTHYRNQEEFKTIDLSELNTEASQLKFSNAAVAVDHATRSAGFLVPTKKGFKKLSSIGELYVQALPDKEAAREVLLQRRPKRKTKKIKASSNTNNKINTNND